MSSTRWSRACSRSHSTRAMDATQPKTARTLSKSGSLARLGDDGTRHCERHGYENPDNLLHLSPLLDSQPPLSRGRRPFSPFNDSLRLKFAPPLSQSRALRQQRRPVAKAGDEVFGDDFQLEANRLDEWRAVSAEGSVRHRLLLSPTDEAGTQVVHHCQPAAFAAFRSAFARRLRAARLLLHSSAAGDARESRNSFTIRAISRNEPFSDRLRMTSIAILLLFFRLLASAISAACAFV